MALLYMNKFEKKSCSCLPSSFSLTSPLVHVAIVDDKDKNNYNGHKKKMKEYF